MSEEIITFAVRNKALGPQGLLDNTNYLNKNIDIFRLQL